MGKEFNLADIVTNRLQVGKLRRELVDELAQEASRVEQTGIRIRKILDNGIPWPDEIVIEGDLDRDQASALTEVLNMERLAGLRVFPKGIPWPDILSVEINIAAKAGAQGPIVDGP